MAPAQDPQKSGNSAAVPTEVFPRVGSPSSGRWDDLRSSGAGAVDSFRCLAVGLERIGWQLSACELDLDQQTARVELKRADGLLVVLDARGGRCSVTREMQERATVTVGPRHDRARVERLSHRLIGRDWMSGPRQGLRWLCAYVADNASIALPAADVRALFAPVMHGPTGAQP